jgi:hypothetical protein
MRASVTWTVAMALLLSGAVVFAQRYGNDNPSEDDEATSGVGAPTQPAPPGRDNDRRSGVAGAPDIDRGSGTQGTGTPDGPTRGGLTGNEGQGDQGPTGETDY